MITNEKRLLFVLKKRSSYGISYGLANSCKFLCNALTDQGIQCKVVEVVDNNGIDAEVFKYKPTHVSVDALWVVPQKFDVLLPKYPKIQWNVRIHSKTPFLSNEGIAMDWMYGYQETTERYDNFVFSANAYVTTNELNSIGIRTIYLPNVYDPHPHIELDKTIKTPNLNKQHIDIGCFGSVRPLKNHLQQATSAIIFADSIGKKIKFHINSDRVEQKGEPILKNLEKLFENNDKHELIKHPWMNHGEFLNLVSKMELGLQVSFSESFNIVAADFVYKDVPIVGSSDIEWLSQYYKADPNNYQDIVDKLKNAYNFRRLNLQWLNKYKLWKHNRDGVEIWMDYILGKEFVK